MSLEPPLPTGRGRWPLIGIAGRLQTGKDVIANRLIARWNFQRLGFADALKDEVRRRFRRTLLAFWSVFESDIPPANVAAEDAVLELLIRTKPVVVRELLQEYGTEVRRADDPDYWVHKWCQRASVNWERRLVVPDVRFDNEAKTIQRWGYLVKVVRPAASEAAYDHASETGVALWPDSAFDAVFDNSHTLDHLEALVDDFVRPRAAQWPR